MMVTAGTDMTMQMKIIGIEVNLNYWMVTMGTVGNLIMKTTGMTSMIQSIMGNYYCMYMFIEITKIIPAASMRDIVV